MRLLPKLTLLSLGVSAVPLAIAGYSSSRIGQDALRTAIEEHELGAARQAAEQVATRLGNLLSLLRTDAHIFALPRGAGEKPTEEGMQGFLKFVYQQSDDFAAVGLFDDHGEPVGAPLFVQNPAAYPSVSGHEAMGPADVESLRLMAPFGDASRTGQGEGPVFLGGPARTPHMVLAVTFEVRASGGRARILAAEVSLRGLAAKVAALSTPDKDVRLLDGRGRTVGSGSAGGVASLDPHPLPGAPQEGLPPEEFVSTYDSQSHGRAVVGAFARATPHPFGISVETTVESALLPVTRMRWGTTFWIGVSALVAVLVAGALARSLSVRVGALAAGARALSGGDLSARLEPGSSDELGDLATTFNATAASLEAARSEILRQNVEIKGWNETLERRVEEKTAELRQAQEIVLRARSLAAVGELGAGVAHEINNPLTGVLGLAQLLLLELPPEHPAHEMVKDVQEQAERIRKIVSNLLRLAQRQAGEDLRPIDLRRIADDAVELCGPTEMAVAGVTVQRRYADPTPPLRGSALQLQEVIIQLVRNARGAIDGKGTITLETSTPDAGLVRLSVRDTGRGIKPEHLPRIFDPFFTTKANWQGTGMGLSVVHKIVEDHGGTIRVESAPGQGTSFHLTFPVHTGSLHLT